MAAAARLSDAQRRAVTGSDPATGRLDTRESTCLALAAQGLAVRYGRVGDHYLTPEGLRLRAALTAPPPAADPAVTTGTDEAPGPPAGPAEPGVFAADDGNGSGTALADRAAEVAAAWEGLVRIRAAVQDGDTTRPAPWERVRPVHSVSLALEAAGRPPSAIDAGRRVRDGYAVDHSVQDGVVRVSWHRTAAPGGRRDTGTRDDSERTAALTGCQSVLERQGWQCTLHKDRSGRPLLLVSPPRR